MTDLLTRGVDHGPYDASELESGTLEDVIGGSLDDERHSAEKSVRVWAKSATFLIPRGSHVQEEFSTDDESEKADALHISVPGGDLHDNVTVVVSIFSANSESRLWSDSEYKNVYALLGPDARKEVRMGLWGPIVAGSTSNQSVYVLGADGPRWMIKIAAYAAEMNDAAVSRVKAILDSVIVNRPRNEAIPEGQPLDLSVFNTSGASAVDVPSVDHESRSMGRSSPIESLRRVSEVVASGRPVDDAFIDA